MTYSDPEKKQAEEGSCWVYPELLQAASQAAWENGSSDNRDYRPEDLEYEEMSLREACETLTGRSIGHGSAFGVRIDDVYLGIDDEKSQGFIEYRDNRVVAATFVELYEEDNRDSTYLDAHIAQDDIPAGWDELEFDENWVTDEQYTVDLAVSQFNNVRPEITGIHQDL
ncbi:MAG: hypothetical protein ABEJ99_05590 [Candidatus Nanohaloarchaea archaeon]